MAKATNVSICGAQNDYVHAVATTSVLVCGQYRNGYNRSDRHKMQLPEIEKVSGQFIEYNHQIPGSCLLVVVLAT
jgi:hypothetical protein